MFTPFFLLMRFFVPRLLLAAVVLTAAGACTRKEITVYVAPKDPAQAPVATPKTSTTPNTAGASNDPNVPNPSARPPLPRMAWKLPPGWTEAPPGELSVAGFKLPSDGGQASVSITPLPDLSGREADIVGMWREQA